MGIEYLHDKTEIALALLQHPELHYYHLGDLDDFFWPYTSWLALRENNKIEALSLIYNGIDPLVLLAIECGNREAMCRLLQAALKVLPRSFYSHLSPGLEEVFIGQYTLENHGAYLKMALHHPGKLARIVKAKPILLNTKDVPRLRTLYELSYPGNWFDPRMLETQQYLGIEDNKGNLLAAGGVHVYSQKYQVAALGNITTLPEQRGKGLATQLTASLCEHLLKSVSSIGLNVKMDNPAAIHIYEKLGFAKVAEYNEWMISAK